MTQTSFGTIIGFAGDWLHADDALSIYRPVIRTNDGEYVIASTYEWSGKDLRPIKRSSLSSYIELDLSKLGPVNKGENVIACPQGFIQAMKSYAARELSRQILEMEQWPLHGEVRYSKGTRGKLRTIRNRIFGTVERFMLLDMFDPVYAGSLSSNAQEERLALGHRLVLQSHPRNEKDLDKPLADQYIIMGLYRRNEESALKSLAEDAIIFCGEDFSDEDDFMQTIKSVAKECTKRYADKVGAVRGPKITDKDQRIRTTAGETTNESMQITRPNNNTLIEQQSIKVECPHNQRLHKQRRHEQRKHEASMTQSPMKAIVIFRDAHGKRFKVSGYVTTTMKGIRLTSFRTKKAIEIPESRIIKVQGLRQTSCTLCDARRENSGRR